MVKRRKKCPICGKPMIGYPAISRQGYTHKQNLIKVF